MVVAAVLMFVVAALALTGLELATGRALSGGSGTTVGQVAEPGSRPPAAPRSTPSSTTYPHRDADADAEPQPGAERDGPLERADRALLPLGQRHPLLERDTDRLADPVSLVDALSAGLGAGHPGGRRTPWPRGRPDGRSDPFPGAEPAVVPRARRARSCP